jgi:hypothetical protein
VLLSLFTGIVSGEPVSPKKSSMPASEGTARAVSDDAEPALEVLFIGNSFTWGLGGSKSVAEIFDALANAAGHADPVTEMRAVSGQDFQFHSTDATTLATIASRTWTHVVLQNNSTEPTHITPNGVEDHNTYGRDLYEQVAASSASTQVMLYQTWARAANHPLISGTSTPSTFATTDEMLEELRTNYIALADSLNAAFPENPPVVVNPVGDAWSNAGGNLPASDPDFIDLFHTDNYHGDDRGYYLSACVHYSSIYGSSPEGLYDSPLLMDLDLEVSMEDAAFLERIAWETVSPASVPLELDAAVKTSPVTLELIFTKALDAESSTNPANYMVASGGALIGARTTSLSTDGRTVTLSLDAGLADNFVVRVNPLIEDVSGTPLNSAVFASGRSQPMGDVEICIDFGAMANRTLDDPSGRTWNNIVEGSDFSSSPHTLLLASDGSDSGIQLSIAGTSATPSVGFNRSPNQNGLNPSAGPVWETYGFPSSVTSDNLFGHADSAWGNDEAISEVTLTLAGLDTTQTYDFTFFASRQGVTDNRETGYRVSGDGPDTLVFLDAANSSGEVASVTGVVPNASGEISVVVGEGLNNTNTNGFFYLGGMRIFAEGDLVEPAIHPLVILEEVLVVDWDGEGQLMTTNDLSGPWSPLPATLPPHWENWTDQTSRFYKLEYAK